MMPLFFGETEAPLYGVYHPPQGPPRNSGVLLCYPFGQEYMRAHRAYRQLSILLTKKGFHVLRFDYRGTGDSSGILEDVTADTWVHDVDLAIQELRDTANISQVAVVGLRLGALVVATACGKRSDVDRLVVWDPVLSGEAYARELSAAIAAEVTSPYGAPSGNLVAPDGSLAFNGFVIPAPLRASFAKCDLVTCVPSTVRSVLQIVSHETEEFEALRQAWKVHHGYRYRYAAAPHDWNYVDHVGGILLPQPVIQSIVEWLSAEDVR